MINGLLGGRARYDRDNAHTDAMTGFNVQLSQRPHNVFYIQSHFEVSEQETFLIRLRECSEYTRNASVYPGVSVE